MDIIYNNSFTLYYQPKISLETMKVHSCEALIRLIKDGKVIPPSNFLPQAEKDGSIIEIDKWVLQKVPEDARKIYVKTFEEKIKVSFNISAIHFSRDDFYKNAINIFHSSRDFKAYFEIEITESTLLNDKKKSLKTINKLKEEGFDFAIDDFGTGYASLELFKYLPIDTLKIDKLFIDDMLNNNKALAIVDAILYLAEKLGITTVGEGVEMVEQLEQLFTMNCSEIQGYFYSKPLPLEKFILYIISINKPQKKNKFIDWSNICALNLESFDSQHMIIINLLNSLYNVIQNKGFKEEKLIYDYVSIIDDSILTHLNLEENFMVKYNYPQTEEHKLEHLKFIKEYNEFKRTLSTKNENNIVNMFNLLKELFFNHELKSDRKLCNFVKEKLNVN